MRKLLIWTRIPTHHQSAFFSALRNAGFDLVVHYYTRVGEARRNLGWSVPDHLPNGERYVSQHLNAVGQCPDWHERIHIVPGYGASFLLQLATWLSLRNQKWLHWSEPSQYSYRSYLTYPARRYYGALVDRYALGALAIGDLAHRDFIRWGISETKIRFLPYAVAGLDPLPSADLSSQSDSPRFLFLGQLCRRKGIDILLKAFRVVLNDYPGARLELVGHDTSQGEYANLARTLRLDSRVQFSNSVPAAEIGSVIARHQILVLPSRHDGWGMVLNEGASAGKALIASDACGSAHHLIAPHRNGFRVAAGDVRALAQAMLTYGRRPELIQAHGEESRKIFADFTPEQNAQRLTLALESLAS